MKCELAGEMTMRRPWNPPCLRTVDSSLKEGESTFRVATGLVGDLEHLCRDDRGRLATGCRSLTEDEPKSATMGETLLFNRRPNGMRRSPDAGGPGNTGSTPSDRPEKRVG